MAASKPRFVALRALLGFFVSLALLPYQTLKTAVAGWLTAVQALLSSLGVPGFRKSAEEDLPSYKPKDLKEAYDRTEEWLSAQLLAKDAAKEPRAKLILTGNLFGTPSTAPKLKEVLHDFLGRSEHLRALWIHDARAGWTPTAVARAWMMDGFPELEQFASCGLESAGLWINRWRAEGAGMLLCDKLTRTYKQAFQAATVQDVLRIIDEVDLLYLPGGNPYTLLEALRSEYGAQVWARAEERIEAGELVLLTRSAGTIVAGATVDVSTERPENWSGDSTGLCLPPAPLAFIPHFHLPQTVWMRHSHEWREATGKGQWSKEDFLAALEAESTRSQWGKLKAKAVLSSKLKRASMASKLKQLADAAAADETAAEARSKLIRGVPLREGSFVAFNGLTVINHQGPAPSQLPSWLAARVRQSEAAFWSLMWSLAELDVSLEEMRLRPKAERAEETKHAVAVLLLLPCYLVAGLVKAAALLLYHTFAQPLSAQYREPIKPSSALLSEPDLGIKVAVTADGLGSLVCLPVCLYVLWLQSTYLFLRGKWDHALSASWSCPRRPNKIRADVNVPFLGVETGVALAGTKPKRRAHKEA